MAIDLALLPWPEAIETLDFEQILGEMRADIVALLAGEEGGTEIAAVFELETEIAHKLLQVCAYREVLIRARVNDAVRANLLAFALRSDLDHLAAFYDVIRLPGESDERLRVRVVLAIQGRSTGGTAPRYRFVALSASLRVADAVVYTVGTDPTVRVAVYSSDNDGQADAALLETVRAALTAPAVRMVNDTILVEAAVFTVVDVVADVWILPETPATLLGDIEAAVQAAWTAETGLGFDLTRAWLTARLMRPGVQAVEILSPTADVVAEPHRAISIGEVTLNNRGRRY